MYWKEIRRSEHFDKFHKGALAWSDIVRLVYLIKSKRIKGNKIEIENRRIYILCGVKEKVLYVINVKRKK
ncbi:MAG: hypothetical protein ABIB71_04345 [Candidatus Woesearchaeota archaeon]